MRSLCALMVTVLTVGLGACKGKKSEETGESGSPSASAAFSVAQGSGRFKFLLRPAVDPDDKVIEPLFTKTSRLKDVVAAMGVFALPRDIPVLVTGEGACKGNKNAFYMPHPTTPGIFICYPLWAEVYRGFLKAGMQDQDAAEATLNAAAFVTMHEMGHALVGQLKLGITGREEDAVDQLSALILINNKKPQWAIDGTKALLIIAKTPPNPKFADEHPMSEARFFDILCLILGSNPNAFPEILKGEPELRQRAPKCPKEYANTDRGWTNILGPYQRK